MNILFVAPRYHPNQHGWAKTLQQRGHTVSYLVLRKSESENYTALTPTVVTQKRIPWVIALATKMYEWLRRQQHRPSRLMWPSYQAVRNYIEAQTPAVIIIRDLSTWLTLQTTIAAKRQRIPVILYTQQPLEADRSGLARLLERLGYISSIRITPVRRDRRHDRHPTDQTFYVPLVVSDASQTMVDDQPAKVIFVGKFGLPRKNHLLLLRALATLIAQNIPVTATLVGSYHTEDTAHMQAITDAIKALNLQHIVTLETNIEQSKMTELYAKHNIFALPSVGEPYAVSVLEAMSHGLPVIVSDDGGAQYDVPSSGLVTPANDETAFTAALVSLATNPSLRKALGAHGHQKIIYEHSGDTFYNHFKTVLDIATAPQSPA